MGITISSCCGCILFPGTASLEDDERQELLNHSKLVWLDTPRGGRLPAIDIDIGCAVTVLLSHGNAENISQIYPKYEQMAVTHRVNFFVYEYAGYGISSGAKASEREFYDDISAAFAYLVEKKNIPRSKIILFGRSIGSGPTVELASKQKGLGGMVLESGLESACRTQGLLGCCCASICCCFVHLLLLRPSN